MVEILSPCKQTLRAHPQNLKCLFMVLLLISWISSTLYFISALRGVIRFCFPRKSEVVQKAIAAVEPSSVVVYSDALDLWEEKPGCQYCTGDCGIKELIFPPSTQIDI